jgi:hypothetical protein
VGQPSIKEPVLSLADPPPHSQASPSQLFEQQQHFLNSALATGQVSQRRHAQLLKQRAQRRSLMQQRGLLPQEASTEQAAPNNNWEQEQRQQAARSYAQDQGELEEGSRLQSEIEALMDRQRR